MGKKGKSKQGFISGIAKEFKCITWPKSKEFRSTSFVVLTFVFIYILYIGFFDFILKKGFDFLFR